MDAFDADVLIYAAAADHPLGRRVATLFGVGTPGDVARRLAGVGSVLLVPEVLTKPTADGRDDEVDALAFYLARLDLRPVDQSTAVLAVVLGAQYRLKPIDATHLASAVIVGADRFITNNHRDFDHTIVSEIDITYPDQLAEP